MISGTFVLIASTQGKKVQHRKRAWLKLWRTRRTLRRISWEVLEGVGEGEGEGARATYSLGYV